MKVFFYKKKMKNILNRVILTRYYNYFQNV